MAIVEDFPELRRSLRELIENADGFRLAGSWADGESALVGIPDCRPDVVLMDIELPGMNGVECVRRLRPRIPDAQIMILTVFGAQETVVRALKAGARGYLIKTVSPEELLEEIRELHAGGSPMTPAIARLVANTFHEEEPADDPEALLTLRQEEILSLIARGRRYKEVAEELGVSLHTVRAHIRHIYERLEVHTKAQAIRRYFQKRGGDKG